MLSKIGFIVGFIFSTAAVMTTLDSVTSFNHLYDQIGLLVAMWHAGAINMFDNFAFKQWQINHLSTLSKD